MHSMSIKLQEEFNSNPDSDSGELSKHRKKAWILGFPNIEMPAMHTIYLFWKSFTEILNKFYSNL